MSATKKKVKIQRRVPKFSDLRSLLRFRKPILSSKKRRLARALTIYDLRTIAKRRTPQAPFDYTDGAADKEISLQRARDTFENIEFSPNILKDVSAGRRIHHYVGQATLTTFWNSSNWIYSNDAD
jgi:hypothetical protein